MVFLRTTLIFLIIGICKILALEADDILLSKFHQNVYKLKLIRMEVVSKNMKYVNKFEIKTFKYNRTMTAFNGTYCYKRDIGKELDFIGQVYKRASNEYRIFPIRMRLNYCRYFSHNIFGLLSTLKCGNTTNNCVSKKDVVYHICNFVIDETKFPPLIPTGEFKTEIIAMIGDEVLGVIHVYSEIYLPMKIPYE